MARHRLHVPNPRRQAAGRANWAKRRGFTPEGLERLRQAALLHRPWLSSRGPRTVAGKQAAARNGKARQKGERSIRELRAELAAYQQLIREMRDCRKVARDGPAGRG